MKLDGKTKKKAIDKLPSVGHVDLSSYVRRCLDILAAGQAADIPVLCNAELAVRDFDIPGL